MGWTNFHSHSTFSDGKDSLRDCAEAAIKNKLEAYGFSDHAPVPFENWWSLPEENLQTYLDEIKTLKSEFADRIELFSGLEIDYIPGSPFASRAFVESLKLDYSIGAIHFVDAFETGEAWNIDESDELFRRGVEEIFNGDARKCIERYYDLVEEMILELKPDIVAHLDKIKMFNTDGAFFSEKDQWYKDRVISILDLLAEKNIVMEFNTRGFYKKTVRKFYPGPWIVCEAYSRGVPIMINSDCHNSEEMIKSFKLGSEILLDAGYKKLTVKKDGKWSKFSFNRDGIIT